MGVIGLGRMGNGIAYRAIKAGHTIIGFDQNQESCVAAQEMGVELAPDAAALARDCRIIWLMVPISVIDGVLDSLAPFLKPGDIIIDGGNSFYKDSMRRAQLLEKKGIFYLDCGTSGGIRGRQMGYCLMIGGNKTAFDQVEPLFAAVAAPAAFARMGPSGTGHYVKMVHNGIEYGMMQAYAEGFAILKEGSFKEVPIDLERVSAIWNESSIIRSLLLGLTHEIFEHDQDFKHISGQVAQGGTGQWTVDEAKAHQIPVPVIEQALITRAWSQKSEGNYATKLLALMREKFGGHSVNRIQRKRQ